MIITIIIINDNKYATIMSFYVSFTWRTMYIPLLCCRAVNTFPVYSLTCSENSLDTHDRHFTRLSDGRRVNRKMAMDGLVFFTSLSTIF